MAFEILEALDLKQFAEETPKNLPYGIRRRVEIARALSLKPSLLLLDEPAAGLNTSDLDGLISLIRWIHSEFKICIWMIEHQMQVVMSLCQRIQVIDFGSTIAEGAPDQIQNNPVVMPHNLFLHSEIIQSRQWNLGDKKIIDRQLKYEFMDTLFSMLVGWGINSAMILMAAATFFKHNVLVEQIEQAGVMLEPLLGKASAVVFAVALLLAGISSSVTAGMAGGSIFAGIFEEPYDIEDSHSRWGVLLTLGGAALAIFFIANPFKGLIVSQILLSVQLPFTIFLQLYLTTSKKIMGEYANTPWHTFVLLAIGLFVVVLNVMLLFTLFD